MSRDARVIAVAGAAIALAGGTWLLLPHDPGPAGPPLVAPALAPAPVTPPPPETLAPAPRPATKIQFPIATSDARSALPVLAESDGYANTALTKLFGRKSVLSFLDLDGFVRNFVGTVDNLGTKWAPSLTWPVKTTRGRFITEGTGAATIIGAQNAARYAPLVNLAQSVDAKRAVALYVRMYPLFQQAWDELGPPGTYFNDRVVAVIDELLATPDLPQPIRLRRVDVQGQPRSKSLYLFDDPALQARSAGQKILLRVGKENADALKAKLTEVRALITKGRPPGRP